ncbi:MAG: DoxX family protein [Marinoscillum sp.]|uniref:DoxX family protein n=1 Tax=Marinoscillum sp. TaxID=2024838 RepID=UPI0032F1F726
MKFQDSKLEVNYLSVVTLRIMLSLIFIVASANHFLNTDKVIARIESANFGTIGYLLGSPQVSVILSGIIMLVAGGALLFGYKTRYSALVLVTVLIPITLTIQVGQLATLGPLFKNIAIMGGLLFFSINDNFKKLEQ